MSWFSELFNCNSYDARAQQNKIIDVLSLDFNELNKRVASLQAENTKLKTDAKRFKDESQECPILLNLDAYDVFSIERAFDTNNREHTVVTVIMVGKDGNDHLKEWHFNISRAAHDRLLKQTADYYSDLDINYANTTINKQTT